MPDRPTCLRSLRPNAYGNQHRRGGNEVNSGPQLQGCTMIITSSRPNRHAFADGTLMNQLRVAKVSEVDVNEMIVVAVKFRGRSILRSCPCFSMVVA